MANNPCKNGMYKIAKWSDIDSMMAYASMGLCHRGNVRRDSLDDKAFIAFNISITTRIERETVEADLDMSLWNMVQPISGKEVLHLWKCDCL